MLAESLKSHIESLFHGTKFSDKDNNLYINTILEAVEKIDTCLVEILIKDEKAKKHFFSKVLDTYVMNQFKLIDFFSMNNYFEESFTSYTNKIGLIRKDDFIKKNNDVVLAFPYKDCVLEGGQTKEDQKGKENFFNEILDSDEIDRLFEPKVLTNIKRYSKDGIEENPTISDKDNLILKGNNLLALHSLKKKYAGKIKLIYIDPPYNTGNDSFKYNDSFNHSTWLTFIKNRLEVARELLSDEGVIFVQCDDNEQAYLKVLMDEIFGRDNFIANLIWRKKTGAADANAITTITEIVSIFIKNKENTNKSFNRSKSHDIARYKLSDKYEKRRGKHYIDNLDRGGISYSKALNYSIDCPDGSKTYPNGRKKFTEEGWTWTWSKEKVLWGIKEGFIEFRKSDKKDSGWSVCYKNYLNVNNKDELSERTSPNKNLILDCINTEATKEIFNLFNTKAFNFPKPETLIYKIIDMTTQPNDLVLDFHLGSGTTCAVAHKMGRQYIGIEQMDYIQDITVERMKKVIAGEQGGISKSVNWQGGGDFIYAELKQVPNFDKSNSKLKQEMRYLPIGELEDEDYKISGDEIAINKAFYGVDDE